MNQLEIQELKRAMNKIIEQENLPQPDRILIRQPTKTIGKKGVCTKKIFKKEGESGYKISINTCGHKYIEAENGRYLDRKTGKKYDKYFGVKLPIGEILDTAAHEIAHLKFWKHNAEHKAYTTHIYLSLIKEVSWSNGIPHTG